MDKTESATLDVRALAPRDRHARIFATFDALRPGAAFRLVNDHDPKPLKYQFAVEHAGEATWEPEQEGPEVWVIRIGKVAMGA
ncbi:MAG: hemerythrin [Candidatus Nephthysia bennettiae]|nr:MAG: hemerythrin [Candidatus Dormibacteraeota bacterium]